MVLVRSEDEGVAEAFVCAYEDHPDVRVEAAVFLGILGDDRGAAELVAWPAPTGDLTVRDNLYLRALVHLGPGIGADLSGWPDMDSALLRVARVAIGQGDADALREDIPGLASGAIVAAHRYGEGLLPEDEAQVPVRLLELAVRSLGDATTIAGVVAALESADNEGKAYMLDPVTRRLRALL